MSSSSVFSDTDAALMEQLEEQAEANRDTSEGDDDLAKTVAKLASRVDSLEATIREKDRRIDRLEATDDRQAERIDAFENSALSAAADETNFDDPKQTMDYYAGLPDHVLTGDAFDVSKARHAAIVIWRNWDEWKHSLGNSGYGINTVRRKGSGPRSPMKLKADLEAELPYSLTNSTVYDAMQHLARLSGSEKDVNEKRNKTEYRGGLIEFRQRREGTKVLVWVG